MIKGILTNFWQHGAEGLFDKHADSWLASKRACLKIQENYEVTKEKNKYSTFAEIKREFITALTKEYICHTVFIKQYLMDGELDKYTCASEHRNTLKDLGTNYHKDFISEKPNESMVTTLLNYCDKNPRPNVDITGIIERHNLAEPIMRMFAVFFKPLKTKKCCYWHYGAPNSGKTKFAELLQEIFYTQKLFFGTNSWPELSEEGDYKTQIVLLDDTNVPLFFEKK